MASSVSPPPNFDIAVITGPMYNAALLGCVTIQVYVYVLAFAHEKIVVKALGTFPGLNPKPVLTILPVYSVFFLDLLQTGFATHYACHAEQSYRYVLAGGWGNPLALLSTPWTLLATIAPLTALVAFLVQLFYSWRIWVISHGQRGSFPSSPSSYCSSIDILIFRRLRPHVLLVGSGPLAQINFKHSIKTFDLDPAVTVGGI
ncbi:hypothetical protein B0H14DRAFT_2638667 [Mycena olivaceomarginata]|nr:hypothetical protein B0H14DRAFT_2638667 [Mycena olivaceomarginata]